MVSIISTSPFDSTITSTVSVMIEPSCSVAMVMVSIISTSPFDSTITSTVSVMIEPSCSVAMEIVSIVSTSPVGSTTTSIVSVMVVPSDHCEADIASPPSAGTHTCWPLSSSIHSPSAQPSSSSCSWVSDLMSMRHPVNRAARRAFCPSLPIARESWKSLTITVAVPESSSKRTSRILAGCNAFSMSCTVSSENGTTSIRSPFSSFMIMRTRLPRAPTHAPTGSMAGSFDHTAIFVRWPGSRAIALISTTPEEISGTSSSNRRLTRPGWVRLTTI